MRQLPVGIDALVGMRYLNMHNIWLHPKTKRMLILGQNQKQMHAAHIYASYTHLATENHTSLHTDTGPADE